MNITVERATKYFGMTTFAAKWGEYAREQRVVAITMAQREFARALGRSLLDDEPEYVMGDQVREEFAAYEQALYTLLRDVEPTGSGTAVPSLDQEVRKAPAFTVGGVKGQWSPRALAWLGHIGTVSRNGS